MGADQGRLRVIPDTESTAVSPDWRHERIDAHTRELLDQLVKSRLPCGRSSQERQVLMVGEAGGSSKRVVARYFEMWNSGESSIAAEVLSPDWVDHAHPEVVGAEGVRQAIEAIRAAQPDLRFRIDALLGDGDLVAVVGAVGRGVDQGAPASRLIWLVRLAGGRLAEMWTYRDSSA